MYRLHRKAARLLLERLLPPPGTNIRGHLVSESDLRQVSGYEQRPEDFAALWGRLDQELRLITPTNPAATGGPGDAETPRMYQLTHDFLVTALRAWLNHSRRRTLRVVPNFVSPTMPRPMQRGKRQGSCPRGGSG